MTGTLPPLWAHQAEDLEASWNMPGAFFDWEPRTGKSRVTIETAVRLHDAGLIDGAVIVAPSGVHLNWTREQIPEYWPEDRLPSVRFEWDSTRASTGVKWFYRAARDVMITTDFSWIAMNVEAFMPKTRAQTFVRNVCARRRMLLIVDESHYVKTPNAKRTKVVDNLSMRFPFRRCLTGTPVTQGPFDLFSQYRLLDREMFGTTFQPFKARYGEFERRQFGRNAKPFDSLVEYRNIDELRRKIGRITFVRKKADCIDVPERLIVADRFVLPDHLRRPYDQMLDESRVLIENGAVNAKEVLTRLLRLHQIARGYVTREDGSVHWFKGANPAVDRTIELVRQQLAVGGKAIVWTRFRPDVEALLPAMVKAFGRDAVLVCDGSVDKADRPALRDRFREDPGARIWLGTAATGGIGVDLGSASLMIFYSHGYNMAERVQALERNYGSTQAADRVDVVDLVAASTIDERALHVLHEKAERARDLTPVKFDAETNRRLITGKENER